MSFFRYYWDMQGVSIQNMGDTGILLRDKTSHKNKILRDKTSQGFTASLIGHNASNQLRNNLIQ